MPRLFTLATLMLAATAWGLPSLSQAQAQTYPNKPIKLVVPYAAGGPADLMAREVAQRLGTDLGQAVVIDNQGGGAGVAALGMVARAEADGHTLLFAASGNIVLQPQVSKTGGAELLGKLRPVALVSTGPHVLVVSSKLPVTNLKEFIAYAQANPGKLSYASAGVGGTAHLGAEFFMALAKIDMTHVPYKGTAGAIGDMASGQVQALFSSPPSLQASIDKGYVRALGMSAPGGTGPSAALPVIGSVVPGFEYTTWYAVYAPVATPQPVVDKIGAALQKLLADPALKAKMDSQGVALHWGNAAELQAWTKRDTERWAKVIRDTKISVD